MNVLQAAKGKLCGGKAKSDAVGQKNASDRTSRRLKRGKPLRFVAPLKQSLKRAVQFLNGHLRDTFVTSNQETSALVNRGR